MVAVLGIASLLAAPLAVPAGARSTNRAADVIRRSVQRTAQQGSARVAGDIEFTSTSLNGHTALSGVVDFTGKRGLIDLDLTQLVKQTARFEVRLVDGAVYLDFGSLLRASGKPLRPALANLQWVKMDLSQFGANSGSTPTIGGDASSQLRQLEGITNGSVHQIGSDTVRGVATTHYGADVDIDLALKRLPAALQDKVRKATQLFANLHHIPVEIWIDSAGLIRRFGMSMTISPPHKSSVKVGFTYDLYDFGVPVLVEAPPPDQVTDYSVIQQLVTTTTNPST
jgi:hypothetical protein